MYERRLAILRGPAKRREQVKLQKKFFKLQKKYTALTRQHARAEALETRRIFRKMEVVIRSIAKDYSLTLMLEKTESSILYATKDMDYTSELIRRYNKLYQGKGKKRRRRKRRRRRRKR
jgi:Skp family chaperone for outer membrane proteins